MENRPKQKKKQLREIDSTARRELTKQSRFSQRKEIVSTKQEQNTTKKECLKNHFCSLFELL